MVDAVTLGSESPARRVVLDAIATNDRAGHDNLGSLSFTHGFIPRAEPRRSLPRSHAAWQCSAAVAQKKAPPALPFPDRARR